MPADPRGGGNGVRVRKQVAGGTTTVYIFSGSKVIAEYENSTVPASPTREYVYSGSQLLATIESSVVKYQISDHLSARGITDSSGTVSGQRAHYPYGESWYETGTTTKWQFTSYERDAESGNDYALARSYVNRLGRFSAPDPIAGSIADPQSLNRYAYVGNDPVNSTDPLGLWRWWERIDGSSPRAGGGYDLGWNSLALLRVAFGVVGYREGSPLYDTRLFGLAHLAGLLPLGPGGLPAGDDPAPDDKQKAKERDCFAQLKYRSVKDPWAARAVGATHSFWWVQDRTGAQHMVSAGPSNPNGRSYLNVWVSTDIKNGVDNVSATTHWNSGLSSGNCDGVDKLLAAARGFPQNQIQYRALLGPNSNSAARYLGSVGGFYPIPPPGAWGWDARVPAHP